MCYELIKGEILVDKGFLPILLIIRLKKMDSNVSILEYFMGLLNIAIINNKNKMKLQI